VGSSRCQVYVFGSFGLGVGASIGVINLVVRISRIRPPLKARLVQEITLSVGDYRRIAIFLKDGMNVRFGSVAVAQEFYT